jgi:hypothetical protein
MFPVRSKCSIHLTLTNSFTYRNSTLRNFLSSHVTSSEPLIGTYSRLLFSAAASVHPSLSFVPLFKGDRLTIDKSQFWQFFYLNNAVTDNG